MSRVISLFLLSCLLLLGGWGGCRSKAQNSTSQPSKPDVSAVACKKDSDCQISCLRVKSCCGQLCVCSNSYNKTFLNQLQAKQNKLCPKKKEPCPMAKCAQLNYTYKAVCVKNRCSAQKALLKAPPVLRRLQPVKPVQRIAPKTR